MLEIAPGDVVWMSPSPATGREQRGRRPGLVISGFDYLANVVDLAIVVPMTSVDRGHRAHVPVDCSDLDGSSWAMTEQVRAVSRTRIRGRIGRSDITTLRACREWVADFIDL